MKNCIQIDFFQLFYSLCVQHSPVFFYIMLQEREKKRTEAKSITIPVFMQLYNKPYDYCDFAMHKNESIDQICCTKE